MFLGLIIEAMQERGLWDDTLTVFWSDHGDMVGDHQRLHKQCFERGSVEVPLVFRRPGHVPAGVTTEALADVMDVFPTVLEAVGAPPSERCQAKSLMPIFIDPNAAVHDAVTSEVFTADRHRVMVRTHRWRYVVASPGGAYILYDLDNDPHERRNLVGHPDYRHVEADLRDRLLQFFLSTQLAKPLINQ